MKLRKEVKGILIGVAMIALFTVFVVYTSNRFEKIESGEMTLVSQSEMK